MSTWTTITDGRVDADSPVTEALVTDLRENTEYNHERAVRSGSHATGTRIAICKGRKAWNDNVDVNGNLEKTVPITYASDSDDGEDPNFDSNVVVVYSMEEDTASSRVAWNPNWYTAGGTNLDEGLWHYILDGTADDGLGFDIEIIIQKCATSSAAVGGFINWVAFGAVSSGE